jgi:hypothetical protein
MLEWNRRGAPDFCTSFSLGDVAFGLCLNIACQFDPFEVQVPLPYDEAAWDKDADDSQPCASALGLHGSMRATGRTS